MRRVLLCQRRILCARVVGGRREMCRTASVPRSRVLLEGEKADEAKPSAASQAQMALGGGAAVAGGGLIAWEHSAWLLSNDVLGGSHVVVGFALAAAAAPQARAALFGEKDEKQKARFKFTLLNDDESHAQARTDLEKTTAASRGLDGLPADVRKLLDDARARATPRPTARRARRAEAAELVRRSSPRAARRRVSGGGPTTCALRCGRGVSWSTLTRRGRARAARSARARA